MVATKVILYNEPCHLSAVVSPMSDNPLVLKSPWHWDPER